MARLHAEALSLAYTGQLVVDNLSVEIPEGKITALVGANGSGKSTILKALARVLKPRGARPTSTGKPFTPSRPRLSRGRSPSCRRVRKRLTG